MISKEIDSLADRIAENAAHIDTATHALLTDVRVFDESGGWYRMGAKSCAHYLSWRIGLGPGAAREKVRVARALADVPAIDEAFATGRISYSKVRAMTRVATADSEAALLEVALSATAQQLERTCRLLRQTQIASDEPARDRDRRWVSNRGTADGMVSVQLRLRPEEAALVMRAISQHVPMGGDRADGAVALAEIALAQNRSSGNADVAVAAENRSSGNADVAVAAQNRSSGNADVARNAKRVMAPATDVLVTIDAATLTGETELGDGVPAETCRRILCDAGVVPVPADASGDTLDVGRKTRVIATAIRRALHHRDRGCRFPGCDARHVDAHHVVHWLDNGETKLQNLISLCRFHHGRLHDGVFSLATESDTLVFRNKYGAVLVNAPRRPAAQATTPRTDNVLRGLIIHHMTAVPNWDGTPPDYDWIVGAVCNASRAM